MAKPHESHTHAGGVPLLAELRGASQVHSAATQDVIRRGQRLFSAGANHLTYPLVERSVTPVSGTDKLIMVGAIGFESIIKRSFKHMQSSG